MQKSLDFGPESVSDKTIESYAIKEGAHDFLVKVQIDNRLMECIMQCSIERRKRSSSII
jgi:FixJ family two-component response regulator